MATNLVDASLADFVLDAGYGVCGSLEECRRQLVSHGASQLTPPAVARCLGVMIRTYTGLTSSGTLHSLQPAASIWATEKHSDSPVTWDMEVLVRTVHELAPTLQWKEVVLHLDHPGFQVKDRQALVLLTQALQLGLQLQAGNGDADFPVELLYRVWKNADSQLSYIKQVLKNGDVFRLSDHRCHLVDVTHLKVPPDKDDKELSVWRCTELVQLLLQLADSGHTCAVQELLQLPVQAGPDLLTLSLLASDSCSQMARELLSSLFLIFLTGHHPNSGSVLHHAWYSPHSSAAVRTLLVHTMTEWYRQGEADHTRLSRILDVAQDLKALSLLLNCQALPFVVDLACLASRREYLKLDKWLGDKIHEHGEPFAAAVVKFLQRRVPQLTAAPVKELEPPPRAPLHPELVATILNVLHQRTAGFSQELSEAILTMVANAGQVLASRPRLPPPGVARPPPSLAALTPAEQAPGHNAQLYPGVGSDTLIGGLGAGGPPGPPPPTTGLPPPASSVPAVSGCFPPTLFSAATAALGSAIGPLASSTAPPTRTLHPESAAIAQQVEEEANTYFQRIYNHPPHPTLSIVEVLDMLRRYQHSSVQHERDVFHCMLRSLMDEYKFFPQYPDKELYITAQLFGGIIEHNLVTNYMSLGLALRYVLDAVKKPAGCKMYNFGVVALDRFRHRLREYPQYCQHLASVEHFRQMPRHLVQYVEFGVRSQEPVPRPEGAVLPALSESAARVGATPVSVAPPAATLASSVVTTSGRPSIANSVSVETLLKAVPETMPPVEQVQDKVGFIFNNLSQLNLTQKCDDLLEALSEEYWPWLAQYMVMRRVSIEPNFHTLYANFLETMGNPQLEAVVVKELHRNIQVLLRSDKGVDKFNDRAILKNLGHWLGMMTVAKNKPILQVDLDLKALVVEAFHLGMHELLYIVPFVAKVLESCAKSKIFKPPNPWTMGLMNLLAELHQEPELKLNLKFEVEVLCKTLSLDVNELRPSRWLQDPARLQQLPAQLRPLSPAAPATDQLPAVKSAPEPELPRFSFTDITSSSISGPATHISVSPTLPLLPCLPQLKSIVQAAVERTVQDWLPRAVERSCKLAVNTAALVVSKDFALESDEQLMRLAAHRMTLHLTSSLTLIHCRHHLALSIGHNLRAALLTALRTATPQQRELVEPTALLAASDNVEVACCYIQKTAAEKALLEVDKLLAVEYEHRKLARAEGRRYVDAQVAAHQEARLPEPLRLTNMAGLQRAVYEQFGRALPGFAPSPEPLPTQQTPLPAPPTQPPPSLSARTSQPPPPPPPPPPPVAPPGGDELAALLEKVALQLQAQAQTLPASRPAQSLARLAEEVAAAHATQDPTQHSQLVKRVVEGMLEFPAAPQPDVELVVRQREAHLLVLRALQDLRAYGPHWVQKHVTSALCEWRGDLRLSSESLGALLAARLVSLPQMDSTLANSMEAGVYSAVFLVMQLLQFFFVDNQNSYSVSCEDMALSIEALTKISQQPGCPGNISALLELVNNSQQLPVPTDRTSGGPTAHIHKGIVQAREFDDPVGLQEKTEYLLREWIQLYHSPGSGRDSTKAFTTIVHQMNLQGILKTDDLITRFFRLSTQICVDLCYRALSEPSGLAPSLVRAKCFRTLDAFVRLIALLVKHSGESPHAVSKINLLNKVLGIVTGVLLQDHQVRKTDFQQLPYHRIFIMLLADLHSPETVLEVINFQVLTAFCNVLHILRPEKAAGFAYAWLDMVSHRMFIGRMLAITPQHKGWGPYAQLLIDLFSFLSPFLRNAELAKPITILYKGCLRVLLVLLHDFPEFLCDYHYNFCDVIPPNCIQMRNLVLSAFPRDQPPPDPFSSELQVDQIPEIRQAPMIQTSFASLIQPAAFKTELDSYLQSRTPVTFVTDLRSTLQVGAQPGCRYQVSLMNALVLYVGTQAIDCIQAQGGQPSRQTIAHSSHMDIFQSLVVDLDTEGRYLLLNAIANQLRYPNSHTNYYHHLVLYLFAEANTPAIQEQITRVLLERLIVNRPHPWGLLITFIELIKNPSFNFWGHEFVHCAPEIEKLFDRVARSCAAQGQKVAAMRAASAQQQAAASSQ